MVTLGDFMSLISNYYSDAATIEVFDKEKISKDCDCLADDLVGFVFSTAVGEENDFLVPRYANAEIKEIYIKKGRKLKVLVCKPRGFREE